MQGGGSARDTLSALELMASTGGDVSDVIDLDEFVQAMIDHDPGRVLTAMAHAIGLGRDARTLTEELIRHLRNGFLSLMAPELMQLPQHRVDEVAAQSQQLGAAAPQTRTGWNWWPARASSETGSSARPRTWTPPSPFSRSKPSKRWPRNWEPGPSTRS